MFSLPSPGPAHDPGRTHATQKYYFRLCTSESRQQFTTVAEQRETRSMHVREEKPERREEWGVPI